MDWQEILKWIGIFVTGGGLVKLLDLWRVRRKDVTDEWRQLYAEAKTDREKAKVDQEKAKELADNWSLEKHNLERRLDFMQFKIEEARRSNGTIIAWQGVGGEMLIRDSNPLVTTFFHWTYDELLNKPVKILMPERFHKPHDEGIKKLIDTGKMTLGGIWLRESKGVRLMGLRKGGEEFPIAIRLAGFIDAGLWRLSAEIMED